MNSENDVERVDNFKRIERVGLTDLEELSSPHTRSLFTWWKSFHPAIPSRDDFDIADHTGLAANVYLFEVLEPGKYLYRLNGEKVAKMIGVSYRMQPISLDNPKIDDRLLADHLNKMFEARTPYRCTGDLQTLNNGIVEFESVDCPLMDKDGKITHFIGVIVNLDEEPDLYHFP